MFPEKNLYLLFYPLSVLLLTILLISCGQKTKEESTSTGTDTSSGESTGTNAESPGKTIFYTRSEVNNISCADCHSDGTNGDKPLTAYFSDVIGANKRESTYHGMFKGDEVQKNAGGATVCWETYLRIKSPLTGEQISQLNDYFNMLDPEASSSPVKEYETIALPVKDKKKLRDVQKEVSALKGDPANGEILFNNGCAFCHGENSQIKKVPDVLEDFEGNVKSITFMLRLGDAAMPFFHQGTLSDQDIADIAAYMTQNK